MELKGKYTKLVSARRINRNTKLFLSSEKHTLLRTSMYVFYTRLSPYFLNKISVKTSSQQLEYFLQVCAIKNIICHFLIMFLSRSVFSSFYIKQMRYVPWKSPEFAKSTKSGKYKILIQNSKMFYSISVVKSGNPYTKFSKAQYTIFSSIYFSKYN